MRNDVTKLIQKCNNENVFLSLKPRIDDLSTTIAHLYSLGGKMCYFNMPDGNNFHIWDKEYEKYSYGEFEFVPGRGFQYLFTNWDNMIKTCYNRAQDEDNFKNGKISGKVPVNHYERMRENMIAVYNSTLGEGMLAVIDMEYSIDRAKLDNEEIVKNPKADLICATVENGKIVFYITEYKSTNNGFGVSLQEHYDDMSMYYNDVRIKEHLIKTLQERLRYNLLACPENVADSIRSLTIEDVDVRLLFLFSHASDFAYARRNILSKGYKYIAEKSRTDNTPVKYAYIKVIETDCFINLSIRDFEEDGMFEFIYK